MPAGKEISETVECPDEQYEGGLLKPYDMLEFDRRITGKLCNFIMKQYADKRCFFANSGGIQSGSTIRILAVLLGVHRNSLAAVVSRFFGRKAVFV